MRCVRMTYYANNKKLTTCEIAFVMYTFRLQNQQTFRYIGNLPLTLICDKKLDITNTRNFFSKIDYNNM